MPNAVADTWTEGLQPDPARRPGVLAAAFRRAMSMGPMTTSEVAVVLTVVVLGFIASLLRPPVAWVVAAVVFVAVATVVAAAVAIIAIPRQVRRAVEAMAFLGDWEQRRAQALGFDTIPTTPDAARRWLETHPERPADGWFRIEVLLMAGRVREAADVAARLPVDTPWERFERVLNEDWIRWSAGGDGDPAAVREAAAAVGGEDDDTRLRAEVAAAVMEARRVAVRGGDAVAVLAEERKRLGAHPGARLPWAVRRSALVAGLGGAMVVALLVYLEPIADFVAELFR